MIKVRICSEHKYDIILGKGKNPWKVRTNWLVYPIPVQLVLWVIGSFSSSSSSSSPPQPVCFWVQSEALWLFCIFMDELVDSCSFLVHYLLLFFHKIRGWFLAVTDERLCGFLFWHVQDLLLWYRIYHLPDSLAAFSFLLRTFLWKLQFYNMDDFNPWSLDGLFMVQKITT